MILGVFLMFLARLAYLEAAEREREREREERGILKTTERGTKRIGGSNDQEAFSVLYGPECGDGFVNVVVGRADVSNHHRLGITAQ